MNRVHKDNIVPKYQTGSWTWDEHNHNIKFASGSSEVLPQDSGVKSSNDFIFKSTMNQINEVIFRQEFTRSDSTFDADVIVIQDIKNLVLFLAPSKILTNKLIDFIHTQTVDLFLNALIIYFEYFIRLVEYILIRRDEMMGKAAQVESTESIEIKRIFSEYLSQYRILLAREYSAILLGNGEMMPYYHMTPVVNISKSTKDKTFHEAFLAICTQIVWIAHHRRAYDIIDDEMNRLFRSHHFKLNRKDAIEFSLVEQELLFGRNNRHTNYRYQNSPLIQELSNVQRKHLPVLWIGERKYRGTDIRMQQLEIEIIIPDGQLFLVDICHGILGHPKFLYNTLLTLDWGQLREENYSKDYDPYRLVTQPTLEMPKLDILKVTHEQFESYFSLKGKRTEYSTELIKKWKRRDKVIDNIQSGGLLDDVVSKCRKEIEQIGMYNRRSSMQTTADFIALKQKLLKTK